MGESRSHQGRPMHQESATRKKIWIVDDEKELAETYAEFLADDFTPAVFSSPEGALLAWRQSSTRPDLLISDMKMPGTDGLSFVKEVRGLGLTQPVLMISGYTEKSHILEAQNLDVSVFLEKPFEPEKLRQAIHRLLASEDAKIQNEQLLALFLKERVQFELLLSSGAQRYVMAENFAAEAGAFKLAGPERKAAFLRMLFKENKMYRDLRRLQREISELLKFRAA